MNRNSRYVLPLVAASVIVLITLVLPPQPSKEFVIAAEGDKQTVQSHENDSATVTEARGRARILHETIHGALQVMHRDFFREDEGLAIPSKSLDDVFKELARQYGVKANWLAVSTDAMNIDHKPRDEFEKQAVRVLRSGKQEFEAVGEEVYQYAGVIRLSAGCLKCHLSRRTSNKDRAAGLVLRIPLKTKQQQKPDDAGK